MAKNSLLVIPCNEDTALRLKETLEKKYGTVPGFCVTIDLDESNLIRIQKENLDFSSFLDPLPASYSLGNTKSKSSNPPASPFSFYLFLLNGTRRLQSAI